MTEKTNNGGNANRKRKLKWFYRDLLKILI